MILVHYFNIAGPVKYPLLAVAIFALGIIFERMLTFARVPKPKEAEKQLHILEEAMKKGGMEECVKVVSKGKGLLNYVIAHLLRRYDTLLMEKNDLIRLMGGTEKAYMKNDITAYMADANEEEEFRTELHITMDDATRLYVGKWLPALSTSSYIAPLLGLLGTVTGMIVSFEAIVQAGTGDPRVVAGGISQALLCTAFGLVIAIVAAVLHRWLGARAEIARTSVEVYAVAFSNTLLAMLREKK